MLQPVPVASPPTGSTIWKKQSVARWTQLFRSYFCKEPLAIWYRPKTSVLPASNWRALGSVSRWPSRRRGTQGNADSSGVAHASLTPYQFSRVPLYNEQLKEFVRALHRGGAKILLGADAPNQF